MDSYVTIDIYAESEIIEKRSRFLGYIKKVNTEEQAQSFISQIKSMHHDARHNVFAYRLLSGEKRYSDDGEPQGTAGIPILDIIEKEDIYDICIVVTRYFGGILLGTGGLVRAYSAAAKSALDRAGRVEMILCDIMSLSCSYNQYGKIPSIISSFDGRTDDTKFLDNVIIKFHIPNNKTDGFVKELTEFSKGSLSAEFMTKNFFRK